LSPLLPIFRIESLSMNWFETLPESVKADVHSHGTRIKISSGQRLFSRGDPSSGLYCLLEGAVRLSGFSNDGQETVLDFYGPGFWFGEVSVLDGLDRSHDARGETDALLLHLTPANMEYLLLAHPVFSRGLLRLEALRLRLLLTAIESYSVQSLEQRLANRLLMLAVTFGIDSELGIRLDLHLPQETLAQLIGSTRQRINQIFKEWELAGIATQEYGRVVLVDREKLETIAAM
jgi:CRP-like cAMP-binding protein